MSLRTRLNRLATASAPPAERPPLVIEQDAPGAPVRFYRGRPATWGRAGVAADLGEAVEMDPAEFVRRYVEPFPGTYALTWADQPWGADLYGGRTSGSGPAVLVNWPQKRAPR